MNRTSDSHASGRNDARRATAAAVARKRVPVRMRRRIERITVPSLAEAERRMRKHAGFFASLTPEQLEMIKAYDGPEILGRSDGPRRKLDENRG
jgi:hypothetical protein